MECHITMDLFLFYLDKWASVSRGFLMCHFQQPPIEYLNIPWGEQTTLLERPSTFRTELKVERDVEVKERTGKVSWSLQRIISYLPIYIRPSTFRTVLKVERDVEVKERTSKVRRNLKRRIQTTN